MREYKALEPPYPVKFVSKLFYLKDLLQTVMFGLYGVLGTKIVPKR